MQNENLMSSSSLEDEYVKNREGEDPGNIKDFMIDCTSGRVAYAVLPYGGVLDMGNKLFAVPMSALQLDKNKECFILDSTKEELQNVPRFDKDNWPDMADRRWGVKVSIVFIRRSPTGKERKEISFLHQVASLISTNADCVRWLPFYLYLPLNEKLEVDKVGRWLMPTNRLIFHRTNLIRVEILKYEDALSALEFPVWRRNWQNL